MPLQAQDIARSLRYVCGAGLRRQLPRWIEGDERLRHRMQRPPGLRMRGRVDHSRIARVIPFVISIVIAFLFAGCLVRTPIRGTPELPSTIGAGPSMRGTPSETPIPSAALPEDTVEGRVVEVIDGDTIKVRIDGGLRTVRYIGIDAPERGEFLGAASTEANRDLVSDGVVLLERDVSDADDYGRLLRYVYLPGGLFVNGELVRRGLARAQAYPPDTRRQAMLTGMEQEARAAGRGLWAQMRATAVPGGPRVRILAVDKRAELVSLANVGNQLQDLTGWTLVSERGHEVCPLAGGLEPQATLHVWARVEDSDRGGYNCGFEGNVWNNSEPDPAALYDAAGRLVDIFP